MKTINLTTIITDELADFVKYCFDESPDEVDLRIYSKGGSVIAGTRIEGFLRDFAGPKTATIEGFAASMATSIMLECDTIRAFQGSYIMIHNPKGGNYTDAKGKEKEMKILNEMQTRMAERYAARTGLSIEEIQKMMDEETYLSADEALEKGFIDEIMQAQTAKFDAESLAFLPMAIAKAITTTKNTTNQPTGLLMKEELFSILGLDAKAEETVAIDKVKALATQLDAKAELINGLNSQIERFKAKEAEMKAFEIEKTQTKLLKDGAMMPEAKQAQFDNWTAKALSGELEISDVEAFVELYAVKNETVIEPTGKRNIAAIANPQEQDAMIAKAMTEIFAENKQLKPAQADDYATAYDMAKAKLNIKE